MMIKLLGARAFSMTETALVVPFQYVQVLIYREHVWHRELTTGITAHGGFGQD